MILVVADGTVYLAENLIPGTGEVFTDENGLLDLSAYETDDLHDGVTEWGAQSE